MFQNESFKFLLFYYILLIIILYFQISNDTVYISNIYIFPITFGLHPQFLVHNSQNPWNFPCDKSHGSIFCYIWFLVLSS